MRCLFISHIVSFGFLESLEEDKNLPIDNQHNHQDSKIPYKIINIPTIFSDLSFQDGFKLNAKGNILFSDNKKMFLNDGDDVSVQDFLNYKVPKIYFQDTNLKDIQELFVKYLSIQIPQIIPIIDKPLVDLIGGCENSKCVLASDKIEKKYIQAIGGNNQEELGLTLNPEIERLDADLYPVLKYKTINADIITAIGGIGEYATGIRSEGIVNANKLIAIGGKQNSASGFLNEHFLNAGNIIAIGGGGLGANGLDNSSSGHEALLKANNIIAIGGTGSYAYGVYNAGKIQTNFLSAIGGENINAPGIYNQKDIQADVLIALVAKNTGVAIFNEGNINAKLLVAIGDGRYYSLINKKGSINAESIYLRGKNALYSTNNALITTSNLSINDFSSIHGNIIFAHSKNSLLSFNISALRWGDGTSFFEIKDGNLTLNPNTKIQANFSNDSILANNLSYGKIYHLLSITGKGELIDYREQKNIEFSGLSIIPQTKIDKKGIAFAFLKDNQSNPFNPPLKQSDEAKTTPSYTKEIIQKLTSISTQAPLIFHSILEANNNGSKFQQIAIDEGTKNFISNPELLISLIEKTDEMFKNNTLSLANISQKTTQYISQKITDRINNVMFERKFYTPTFTELIQKHSLASSDEKVYMPEFSTKNSAWLNIGASYYQGPSSSLNPLSVTSVNSSIGYDREIDIRKDVDFVLGGLFNYAKSFYYQNTQRENLDIFTIGIYSNAIIKEHEIQSNISITELLGNAKIHKEEIGISQEGYINNNFALNIEGVYKYKIVLTQQHSIKPLALMNYSFLYTPSSKSKTFFLKNSYDQVFALGTGGEYHFENSFMQHIFQLTGRYHIADITKSRAISFKGAQTFINYDLLPSRMWVKLSYGGKFVLPSSFNLDFSLSADMSVSGDFLGAGNLGVSYVW